MKRWILLFLSLILLVTARCWNHGQILVDGQIYFVDADCYSRMTRVQQVVQHPGLVLRHHDFENWPEGTTPHTTIPFDYLIALPVWLGVPLDWAGALIPLFLAVATGLVLWKWVEHFRFFTQVAVLGMFAVSPILVHGTVFGRPDHQALLIFLITAALATENTCSKGIALLNGLAWGFSIWTSLFEPVVLLVILSASQLALLRKSWFTRERAISWATLGVVLLLALAIEHWRISSLPDRELFERWSKSIGELASPGCFSMIFLSWLGLSFLAVPLVLGWRLKNEKLWKCLPWFALLVSTWLLSAWMVRWGYFLALAFLFVLPFLLEKVRSRWWMFFFFLGLWPVGGEWDRLLDSRVSEQTAEQIEDYRELRQICAYITTSEGGVVAPWWLSPPVAYWTGAKCVAGSSHQSLPGISDTAMFYISRFPEKSHDILVRRQVSWVLAYEPDRILSTSSTLLNIPAAGDAFGAILYNTPRKVPSFLTLERKNTYFKLYHVTAGL